MTPDLTPGAVPMTTVEDEEESVMGGLGLIFLLEAAEGGEGDGFVIVDEAFAVVVRPAGGSSS